MTPELKWLAATALFTGLVWVPYILALLGQMGVGKALMDGQHATPLDAPWAQRAKRAHANAVENLVVFAALVIVLHLAEAATSLTATAAFVFFLSRIGHWGVYVLGLPLIRTLLFAVGFACQMIIGLTLFGLL
jgi:uncharacterized MAPEG superfamily protein